MDNIRITSGKYRGQNIKSPHSDLTHPMGSREKLALFNMISTKLPGANILDAYAGSGALGIEAMSRGAAHATFIEKNEKVARVIIDNLKKLRLGSTDIHICDVQKFTTDDRYDIIIADPPYDKFKIRAIIYLTKYLKDDGILVVSHPGSTPIISSLNLTTTRKYANANISIYQK